MRRREQVRHGRWDGFNWFRRRGRPAPRRPAKGQATFEGIRYVLPTHELLNPKDGPR